MEAFIDFIVGFIIVPVGVVVLIWGAFRAINKYHPGSPEAQKEFEEELDGIEFAPDFVLKDLQKQVATCESCLTKEEINKNLSSEELRKAKVACAKRSIKYGVCSRYKGSFAKL